MLRCGHCEIICDSYEDWLTHLVSEQHQACLGVSDVLTNFGDEERNQRSLILTQMNPKTKPFEVLCHFAQIQPLGFITDAYVHIFMHSKENFYQIVFDQKKFVDRIVSWHERYGDQRIVDSMVSCKRKTDMTEKEWASKLESSFFYRRHEFLRRQFPDMNWDQQLTKLLSLISLDSKGYQQRESVMEDLEGIIHVECEEYKNATVNAFGSCMTWLADVNADLDIYVDVLGDGGRSDLEMEKKYEILSKIEDMFKSRFGEKNVMTIRNTRVPIIILNHPSGLKIDVSFENCMSVQNSKLIRLMTKLDYRVRPFLIFLRYWARYYNLVGSHSIKSYALVLMAFVFLRKKKILPSVHELQNIEGTRSFMVCNWNAGFCVNRDIVQRELPWLKCCRDPPSSDGMGQEIMRLSYEFFNEYLAADLQTMVVCPLIGNFLPKSQFESQYGVELPQEMGLLKANLVTAVCFGFKTHRPLCVQDPFSLDINVTASCANPDIVYQFKAACSQAAEALRPFIKTYGLADRECILELCCQPISQVKKEEIIQGLVKAAFETLDETEPENHDHLAYVKTEATTTTNEDDEDLSYISGSSRKSQQAKNKDRDPSSKEPELEDALAGVREVVRLQHSCSYEEYNKKKTSSSSPDASTSTLCVSSTDSPRSSSKYTYKDDLIGSRVKRLSMFEDYFASPDEVSRSSSKRKGKALVDYNCDEDIDMDRDIDDTNAPKSSNKAIKSIVVVPSASRGKDSSSSSSSSSSGREKTRKSVSPSSGGPAKKKNRQEEKVNSKEVESGSEPQKRYADILVTVDNSPSKTEPVVKFIATSLPQVSPFAPTVKQEKDENKIADSEIDQLEEFYKALKEDSLHSTPTAGFNPSQVAEFNYGYKTSPSVNSTSGTKPKQVAKPINIKEEETVPVPTASKDIPSQSSSMSSSEHLPSESSEPPRGGGRPSNSSLFPDLPMEYLKEGTRFPDFAEFMDKKYQQHFLTFFSPLLNFQKVVADKKLIYNIMRVNWICSMTALFSENYFWPKFQSVIDSLEIYVLEPDEDCMNIFLKIKEERRRFLDSDKVGLIDIKEVENCDYPPILSPRGSKPTWCLNSELSYDALSFLWFKLTRMPQKPARKLPATAYYFECHLEVFTTLYKKWLEVRDNIFDLCTIKKGPVEIFGALCDMANFETHIKSDPVTIKMIIAHETTEDIPGVFVGFQTSKLDSDPTFEKQVTIQRIIKEILGDLLRTVALQKLHKYLQKQFT